jgi:hypothetical protein
MAGRVPCKKTKIDVSEGCFFWRQRNIFRDFFNRVLELPFLRNAQKRDKQIEQNNREKKKRKKRREKRPRFL